MASLQAQVDAVKAAVASPATCTPSTVVTLKQLLLPEPTQKTSVNSKTTSRSTKPTASKAKTKGGNGEEDTLGTRERTALATHVINLTIKSLTEAAKPQPPASPTKRQTPGAPRLRRSLSTPLSPLQPRSLNRVATSPSVATKSAKLNTSAHATKYLATAECARIALACLRSAKGPVKADQTDFQIENGMSTLAVKLLALGLNELALKELVVLKKRLENGNGPEAATSGGSTAAEKRSVSQLCELLNYHGIVSQNSLAVVATCQIQCLKLIAAFKKPAHIEGVMPFLRDSHLLSPVKVLSKLAKSGEGNAAKAARQMSSLSQTLLSLAPSVSSSEDGVATEPRLSPSPEVAFELQSLAFKTQLKWWKLAGHKGKIDDDILSPFSRCVRCFIRRQPPTSSSSYITIATAFDEIMKMIQSDKHQPDTSFGSPLTTIYQSLGSAANTSRQYEHAHTWYQTLKDLLDPNDGASVRACSVSARLLAVALKRSEPGAADEELVQEVIEGLNASLSGTASEVNDLLESLSLARRSVASLLMNNWKETAAISPNLKNLLKRFLLRFPRFVMRWLGTPPGKDAATKQILQFDQRRQVVLQSVNQVLDGSMMVLKSEIDAKSVEWQTLDDVLQDSALLLRNLHDPALATSRIEQLNSYHVKISTLYFTVFSQLRKKNDQSKADKKQALQALTRSIDAVKERSPAEKEKAQLATKLEMLAELCKGVGRTEDASKTLRSICTNMVEDGVLANVASALATKPPRVAWGETEKASGLSRTLRQIAKLDDTWNDWTFFLQEAERAAVLEHLLQVSTEESSQIKPLGLRDPGMAALLRIYTPDRYPIRRFRVLLKLLSQHIGKKESLDDLFTLLDQTSRYLQKKDMVEDVALVKFLPHLQGYYASLTALGKLDGSFPVSDMKNSVSAWTSMVNDCDQQGCEISSKIDEPEALLDHLLAVNQFAGLRGECRLQLSVLELAIKLAKAHTGPQSDEMISHHCELAAQYVNVGLFTEASKTLDEVKELIRQNQEASPRVVADFYLLQAEYAAGIDNTQDAMVYLSKVNDIYASPAARSRTRMTVALGQASLLQSSLSLQMGDVEDALRAARSSVKMLTHDWTKFEGPSMQVSTRAEPSLAESVLGAARPKLADNVAFGPRLWALAQPLFNSLMHISSLYAHIGLFQETLYYCETAIKIAEGTQSSLFKAQVFAWTASVYVKAGHPEKALEKLDDACDNMPQEASAARVRLARQLSEVYRNIGEDKKAVEYLQIAEETTHLLGRIGQPAVDDAKVEETSAKAGRARGATVTKKAVAQRTTRSRAATTTTTTRVQRRAPAKSKAAIPAKTAATPKDIYQASLLASVVLSRATSFAHQDDWSSVASALQTIKDLPRFAGTLRQEQLIIAAQHISQSVEQMIADPVFSVMHESTISFPAVLGTGDKASPDRSSLSKTLPRRGRAAAADRKGSKEKPAPPFAEALRQAQEVLLEAHASALASGDNAILHRISALLQGTVISLTAASTLKLRATLRSDLTTVAVELARNAVWRREQLAIQCSKPTSQTRGSQQPEMSSDLAQKMAALHLNTDMTSFQNEFIEQVPKNWSVISMSVSEDQHDLCITKFQAGHSPFILRLPLERANSRDADTEVFNFQHGREELLDIIKLANKTSHSGGDLTTKASRNAWWAEREALDERLKELLTVMETTWLGGFKGIFSQHERRPDLLARFQKSFHELLNRSLPSRSGGRGKKTPKPPAITLDPRILDLFIGLGDPTEPDCDFDEALNDLLYFVVDILQFHGERNAYDEIDFDAMVVETYDALRGYHSAAKAEGREDGAHTVLVLDKALHAFPWESMPCMEGAAVSRVPSLACLRRLIAEAKKPAGVDMEASATVDEIPGGHYVSATSGTYMLNPSSDLKNTQAFFQPSFTTLGSWTGLVNRVPKEEDFEKALSNSEVLLYFGHGGGAQYIRGKTVRRLEKCKPATFLMGCSSAALTEAGEFECYGPVWNYMTAGCPAVVGTLWDVTDRDIDRFAGRAFEEWGLFDRGTYKEEKKGKGKQKDADSTMTVEMASESASLAEAVARARSVCRFKYLNAAAVVMYGIPVYIDRGV